MGTYRNPEPEVKGKVSKEAAAAEPGFVSGWQGRSSAALCQRQRADGDLCKGTQAILWTFQETADCTPGSLAEQLQD